jgi:hypothetical protein
MEYRQEGQEHSRSFKNRPGVFLELRGLVCNINPKVVGERL